MPMKRQILIIEDEKVPRTYIEKSIINIDKNIEIISVDSAAEGLFFFFTKQFDLIFLDIMMPQVDGNDFIYVIEKNYKAGNIDKLPNIVVQSSIQSITELTAFTKRECIQEVFKKPLKLKQIETCLKRYCS